MLSRTFGPNALKADRMCAYSKSCDKYDFHLIPYDVLDEIGFFTAPASSKYHGAYEGGLFDHSYQVFRRLEELTKNNNLSWQRDESPLVVGMFHDLCKCDQYIELPFDDAMGAMAYFLADKPQNGKYAHNEDLLLEGHGEKSVMLLSMYTPLTEEEVLCIRYHMGAYQIDDWKGFDRAIKKFETVFYTHAADMLASKVDDV